MTHLKNTFKNVTNIQLTVLYIYFINDGLGLGWVSFRSAAKFATFSGSGRQSQFPRLDLSDASHLSRLLHSSSSSRIVAKTLSKRLWGGNACERSCKTGSGKWERKQSVNVCTQKSSSSVVPLRNRFRLQKPFVSTLRCTVYIPIWFSTTLPQNENFDLTGQNPFITYQKRSFKFIKIMWKLHDHGTNIPKRTLLFPW